MCVCVYIYIYIHFCTTYLSVKLPNQLTTKRNYNKLLMNDSY